MRSKHLFIKQVLQLQIFHSPRQTLLPGSYQNHNSPNPAYGGGGPFLYHVSVSLKMPPKFALAQQSAKCPLCPQASEAFFQVSPALLGLRSDPSQVCIGGPRPFGSFSHHYWLGPQPSLTGEYTVPLSIEPSPFPSESPLSALGRHTGWTRLPKPHSLRMDSFLAGPWTYPGGPIETWPAAPLHALLLFPWSNPGRLGSARHPL